MSLTGDYLAGERASSLDSESYIRIAKISSDSFQRPKRNTGKSAARQNALFCEESGDKQCRHRRRCSRCCRRHLCELCTQRDRTGCNDPVQRLERNLTKQRRPIIDSRLLSTSIKIRETASKSQENNLISSFIFVKQRTFLTASDIDALKCVTWLRSSSNGNRCSQTTMRSE